MNMKIHYLIYKTTNLINHKIYIGKHKTKNIEDRYFGSGQALIADIKKYGIQNFIFEILIDLNSEYEMNLLERLVVNEDFLKRKDVYNLCIGGEGGNLAHINQIYTGEMRRRDLKKYYNNLTDEQKQKINNKRQQGIQQFIADKERFSLYCQKLSIANSKKHSKDTNSYNTIWMCNEILQKNKRINKNDRQTISQFMQNGWKIGRLKFKYKNEFTKSNSIQNLIKRNKTKHYWITNGIDNKQININECIPNGWKRGRAIKNKK